MTRLAQIKIAATLCLVIATIVFVGCSASRGPYNAMKVDRPELAEQLGSQDQPMIVQGPSNGYEQVGGLSTSTPGNIATELTGTSASTGGSQGSQAVQNGAPLTMNRDEQGGPVGVQGEKQGSGSQGQISNAGASPAPSPSLAPRGGNFVGGAGAGGGGGGRGAGGARGGRGGGGGFGGGGRGRGPAINIPVTPEEVWIIAKADPAAGQPDNNAPGTGSLLARVPGQSGEVPVPLKHTDVKASIAGYIATVDVQQQYHNPFTDKIEAVYVFPLPQNSAVNEFLMTIGDRKIRGIIRDRVEAQQIYAEARAQGYVASLLTQERPNIFTQSVANIEPGKEIDIDIKYFNTLDYHDGWYEFVFPMVVGPRFNPPSMGNQGIGAAAQGQPGASGQKVEVQYLRPEQRSGHDISVSLNIDAGVKVEQVASANHQIRHTALGNSMKVELDPADTIPNKDFVLRYKVAGGTVKSALMLQRDKTGNGGYFTLMLIPPSSIQDLPRQALEMVFTLDVSGSMNGAPIEQSRKAIQYALTHMQQGDTFQIVRFASSAQSMSPQPLPPTEENIQNALSYVQQMSASGGTMMMEGIRQSLNFPPDRSRLRFVAFLTDGMIGNDNEILRAVHDALGDSRIFSFGVGSAPNRYLLDNMAKIGKGAVAYLSLNDNADQIMSKYFDRISHPALTHIDVDYGTMQASDVFPAKVPDLFVGRPVVITGRFNGSGQTTLNVKGLVAGQERQFSIPVNLDDAETTHAGIPSVWARQKIASLAEEGLWDQTKDVAGGIKQVALDYGLMSQFTAFVAVDSSTKTAGGEAKTAVVPVPVPDGVNFNTTVRER
jgi:Ca-activated chloride channel family protein